MKNHFAIQDNIIDKKLLRYVNDKTFSSNKNVKSIINKMIDSYAENFENGDKLASLKVLSKSVSAVGVKDASLLSFFAGSLVFMAIQLIIMLTTTLSEADERVNWQLLKNNLPTFRLMFILTLTLTLAALDLQIMRKFKINFTFIFEIDPLFKVSHISLYSVSEIITN